MLRTVSLSLLVLAGELILANRVHAQAYGLTQRPTVGSYLDGAMPPQPPVIGPDWSTTVAFPNLIFQNPVGIVQMPGQNKMVVWEREGRAWFFDKNANIATKTLIFDVSQQCQGWDDSGLLGLAFHPQFSLGGEAGTNRYVFAWYTYVTPGSVQGNEFSRPPTFIAVRDRLARFTLDANGVAVPGSETVFIDQHGNSVWHNGGGMFFHPDNGFLYITNGDDENQGNSQQINGGLFSGVLRVDVDQRGGAISHPPPRSPSGATTANYFIPNDNPFVGVANANEEFFAIGLRSPHRMTIDPVTKRIFISDVGSTSREEVTAIEPNDPPGLNLQWSRIEGLGGDLSPPYIGVNKRPILDYGRDDGSAVIGGYIYRGAEFAGELGGRYIFGDNITNAIWIMDESTIPATKIRLTTLPKGPGPNSGNDYVGLSSFGVDAQGELYLCQLSFTEGRIHKLQRGGTGSQPLPSTLSATGAFSNTAALVPSQKLIPYALNQPFWSDGARKSRWAAIPTLANVGFTPRGEWAWPAGSVFVKHFELPVDDTNPTITRRLETRLLVKMATGATYGATYKWRPDNSDADLIGTAVTENVPIAVAPVGSLTGIDIGAPATAGSTSRSGDVLTMQAGGTDIWDSSDQFHFAQQQRTGDFDISVRFESLTDADLYTKAGLMARESLTAQSRHVYALVFPRNATRNNNNGGYEFQYRAVTGGASAAIYPALPQPQVNYPNTWLRLRREADTFIAYSSVDGVWWSEFARQTLDFPDTIFFGLAATAHTNAATTTAKIHLQTTRRQPWYYPSRNDCISCHTTVAGGVLGPKTRQLNGALLYPSGVTDNQLRAWAHVGLFDNAPPESQIPNLDQLAALSDQSATIEKRGRSYLDANCANCHRPGGAPGFWDARFDIPFAQQGLLYGPLANNLGDPSARVIVPQELLRSVLHRRVNTVGGIQMPPIARNMIDAQGVAVLGQWINGMQPNTPPNVTLTSPNPGATFQQNEPVNFAATASDTDGILKVEFYDGGQKLGEDTTVPYTFAWNGATRGAHDVSVTAIDSIGNSARSAIATINVSGSNFAGFLGEYFTGMTLANLVFDRVDATVNFNWGNGSPDPRIPANGFSVRWSGRVRPRYSETYTFTAATDDGVRVWVNGQLIIDYWYDQPVNRWSGTIDLLADHSYDLVMEYYENGGLATAALFWSSASQAEEVIPQSRTRGPGSNQAPAITLTAPLDGLTFLPGDTLGLSATADDLDGVVARVEFWADGVKLGEDATAPYAFSWPGPHQLGAHALSARAFDELGASATSATVGVQTLSFALIPVQMQRLSNPDRVVATLHTTLPVGRSYVIEFSADLINWTPLRTGVSDGSQIEVIDTATGVEKRFYRARLTN